jgi:hypothetical protein
MEAAALFHPVTDYPEARRDGRPNPAGGNGSDENRQSRVYVRRSQPIGGLLRVAKSKSRACASVDASGLIAGGSSLHSGATSAITGPRAATQRAACERWPGTPITLRQGARVIEDSRRLRVVSSP